MYFNRQKDHSPSRDKPTCRIERRAKTCNSPLPHQQGGFPFSTFSFGILPIYGTPPGRSQVDTPLEVPARERFQRQGPWVICSWGWSSIHTWEYPTTVHICIYIYILIHICVYIYTYMYIYIYTYMYIYIYMRH